MASADTTPNNNHAFQFDLIAAINGQTVMNTWYAITTNPQTGGVGEPNLLTMVGSFATYMQLNYLPLWTQDYVVSTYKVRNIIAVVQSPSGRDKLEYGEGSETDGGGGNQGGKAGARRPTFTAVNVTFKSQRTNRRWVNSIRTPPLLESEVTLDTVNAAIVDDIFTGLNNMMTLASLNANGTGLVFGFYNFSRNFAYLNPGLNPREWTVKPTSVLVENVYGSQRSRRKETVN